MSVRTLCKAVRGGGDDDVVGSSSDRNIHLVHKISIR